MHSKILPFAALVPTLLACNSLLGNDQGQLFADAAASDDGGVAPLQPSGSAGCDAGTKTCNALCVASDDPLYGCGDTTCSPCEIPHAGATCANGRCAIKSCSAGYADCNQDPTDGCETDISTASHCGGCSNACGAAAPYCAPAGNGSFACTNHCPSAAPTLCGSQCADLSTSVSNCGSCAVSCPSVMNGSAVCVDGACGIGCNAGYHACGASCANDDDPSTCGTLCTPCPSGPNSTATCSGTACGFTCTPGFADCSGNAAAGCTVSLMTDPANCGACGRACPAGEPCVGGGCAAPPPVDAGVDSGVDAGFDAGTLVDAKAD